MDISSTVGLLAGVVFVVLAGFNVVLMLEAGRRQNAGTRARLVSLHRIGGYAFVILFCVMVYLMSQRLIGDGLSHQLPINIVMHVALVLGLIPLLLIKIAIARRYKHHQSLLLPLGLAIFITSVVLVALPAFSELLKAADPGGLGFKTTTALVIALSVLLCGSALYSAIKGPIRSWSVPKSANGSMTLRLVRIVQETHNTKTLRFLLPRARPLQARPGQFLTFQWVIDGQRVPRSYTISSSPVRTDHVEITPKRVENGRVSPFLLDRAKIGLTVEATGPYGRFYLDETLHRSIVLIAAGAGITPMISMVRYIAHRGLSIPATLLYGVRTRKDIIFETELERLRKCIPTFNYSVSLSQPDGMWKGGKGRLTREFILDHLTDLDSPTFFLCGPAGFMDGVRQILASLGVNEARITQESFGEHTTGGSPAQSASRATVEFVRSDTVCEFPVGSTLLEVAETNGVTIPFGCRQGQCGTCATRVLSGAVHMDTDAGLTADQKSTGHVLACVSRAAGNVVVQA
jgi:ferredoxin-NADP reductase